MIIGDNPWDWFDTCHVWATIQLGDKKGHLVVVLTLTLIEHNIYTIWYSLPVSMCRNGEIHCTTFPMIDLTGKMTSLSSKSPSQYGTHLLAQTGLNGMDPEWRYRYNLPVSGLLLLKIWHRTNRNIVLVSLFKETKFCGVPVNSPCPIIEASTINCPKEDMTVGIMYQLIHGISPRTARWSQATL